MSNVARWELRPGDPSYPEHLTAFADAPDVLYGYGDPDLLSPGLAVIGSRKATPYGKHTARLFGGWAAARGVVIVSGAAMGCDQAAHCAALDVDGPTVAVLGCGADWDYPARAATLLASIRERGAVVSEFRWGTQPRRWQFIRRNRLIARLSKAVLVVEASLPSGTFSTADFALEAGRDVLAVPGSILAPECRGSNRLIRQGAIPITDISELAQALDIAGSPALQRTGSSCEPLLSALRTNPLRPDDAARALGIDIVEVVRRLSALECDGLVQRYPDGRYGPC